MALFPGVPRWAGTRKVKPIWISLKQETVSGSGISWDICKSAPHSRQITTPTPHRSVFYRPDALPAAQPTASKHWTFPFTYPKTEKDCMYQTNLAEVNPNNSAVFCCFIHRSLNMKLDSLEVNVKLTQGGSAMKNSLPNYTLHDVILLTGKSGVVVT